MGSYMHLKFTRIINTKSMIKEDFEGLLYTPDWRERMAMRQESNNVELKIKCITDLPKVSVDYKN